MMLYAAGLLVATLAKFESAKGLDAIVRPSSAADALFGCKAL
jgi:hypothetical protein